MPNEVISYWASIFSFKITKFTTIISYKKYSRCDLLFHRFLRKLSSRIQIDFPLTSQITDPQKRLSLGDNPDHYQHLSGIQYFCFLCKTEHLFRDISFTTAVTALALIGGLSIRYWSTKDYISTRRLAIGGIPATTAIVPSGWSSAIYRQPSGKRRWQQRYHSVRQGFCHPLQGKGFLSQGSRGITHQGRMEYAYDFGTPMGTPVYAMQSGRVIGVRDIYSDKGGRKNNAEKFNFIWIEHTNGLRSAYLHLQQDFRRKVPIKVNNWIKTGQLIAYSGNSGWSSAPHLHVEVHSMSHVGFGQTVPFVIAARCYNSSIAKSGVSE
jgi:hypothetical protein